MLLNNVLKRSYFIQKLKYNFLPNILRQLLKSCTIRKFELKTKKKSSVNSRIENIKQINLVTKVRCQNF